MPGAAVRLSAMSAPRKTLPHDHGARDVSARVAPLLLAGVLLDEEATDQFGAAMATHLSAGDTVLLSGPLGAGKSTLARSAIRTLLRDPAAPIPSPTYTLVNVYQVPEIGLELWHADLYRLGGAEGIEELGVLDAMPEAIVLIEWPDRLGPHTPERRLEVALDHLAEGRRVNLRAIGQGWEWVERAMGQHP